MRCKLIHRKKRDAWATREAMGTAATIPIWSKGWPHWYWPSRLLTWPVSCWIGLMIGGRNAESPSA